MKEAKGGTGEGSRGRRDGAEEGGEWPAVESTVKTLVLDGKVVIDVVNPIDQNLNVLTLPTGSAAQTVALRATGARVVKAFNTIGSALMGDSTFDMMYCGDDAEAKKVVDSLIADTGMKPVDVGPLSNARYLEAMAGLWIDLVVKQRRPGAFGFNLVKK